MFIKTFKKSIALFVAIVFVVSLVPFGAMAETLEDGTVVVRLSNPVRVRTNSDHAGSPQDYSSFLRCGSNYKAWFQLDFTGYEYLLRDENSTMMFSVAGTASGSKIVNLSMYALDDSADDYKDYYASTGLSYNSVKGDLPGLTAKQLETLTPFAVKPTTSPDTSYSSDANKQVVLDALDASTDDSVVTFELINGGGSSYPDKGGFQHNNTNTYVGIKGGENATAKGYADYVAEQITWDLVSDDVMNNVTQTLTLPEKFLGATIDWESDNETAVNSETGVVTINPAAYTYVTLTANISYATYEGTTATAKKEFDIRLPKVITDYATVASGTLYDGEVNYPAHSGSGATHQPVVEKVPGVAGKADMCYKLHDSNGNRRFDFAKAADWTILDRDMFEFDVCIPSDCYGFYPQLMLYTDKDNKSDDTSASSEFHFKHDGLYSGRGGDLIFPWDGSKWHHVAIVAPGIVSSDASGIEYDRTIKIYVDGVLKETISLYEADYPAPCGTKNLRTNGLCPVSDYTEDQTWDTTACYLDNIRWTYGDIDTILAYNTKSSVVSATDDIDEIGGNLTVVTAGATVKDIIDSVTIDEDAVAKVYDAQWNLLDETAVVADGYMLVVADTNATTEERVYSYYTIRVVDGKTAFDAAYITLDSATGAVAGNVKVYNYSGTDAEYQVYLAIYSEKELKTLIPVTLDADAGKASSVSPSAVLDDGETAKLLIWSEDGITPELKVVTKSR